MSRDHNVYTQDLEDRDDERPQVVQLSQNDLTAEEAKKHWDEEEQSGKKTGGDEDIKGETSIVIDCKLSDYAIVHNTETLSRFVHQIKPQRHRLLLWVD